MSVDTSLVLQALLNKREQASCDVSLYLYGSYIYKSIMIARTRKDLPYSPSNQGWGLVSNSAVHNNGHASSENRADR